MSPRSLLLLRARFVLFRFFFFRLFFFNDPAPTAIYTLSLHDALPICPPALSASVSDLLRLPRVRGRALSSTSMPARSEEHTSELQSHHDLVCRLLLEKKKK